jgi:hypothetical protein
MAMMRGAIRMHFIFLSLVLMRDATFTSYKELGRRGGRTSMHRFKTWSIDEDSEALANFLTSLFPNFNPITPVFKSRVAYPGSRRRSAGGYARVNCRLARPPFTLCFLSRAPCAYVRSRHVPPLVPIASTGRKIQTRKTLPTVA